MKNIQEQKLKFRKTTNIETEEQNDGKNQAKSL